MRSKVPSRRSKRLMKRQSSRSKKKSKDGVGITMSDNVLSFGRSGNEGTRRRLVPQRLVKARKAVPLTQTELAAAVGLTRQAISAFEQGAKHPDGTTMFAIADAVRQPVSYFFAD